MVTWFTVDKKWEFFWNTVKTVIGSSVSSGMTRSSVFCRCRKYKSSTRAYVHKSSESFKTIFKALSIYVLVFLSIYWMEAPWQNLFCDMIHGFVADTRLKLPLFSGLKLLLRTASLIRQVNWSQKVYKIWLSTYARLFSPFAWLFPCSSIYFDNQIKLISDEFIVLSP